MFFSQFWVGKMIFHHCCPPPGKMFLATTWKNTIGPSLKKILMTPMIPNNALSVPPSLLSSPLAKIPPNLCARPMYLLLVGACSRAYMDDYSTEVTRGGRRACPARPAFIRQFRSASCGRVTPRNKRTRPRCASPTSTEITWRCSTSITRTSKVSDCAFVCNRCSLRGAQLRSTARSFAQWNLILARLQRSKFDILYISRRIFTAWKNTFLVVCLRGCAVHDLCKIFLEGTLVVTLRHEAKSPWPVTWFRKVEIVSWQARVWGRTADCCPRFFWSMPLVPCVFFPALPLRSQNAVELCVRVLGRKTGSLRSAASSVQLWYQSPALRDHKIENRALSTTRQAWVLVTETWRHMNSLAFDFVYILKRTIDRIEWCGGDVDGDSLFKFNNVRCLFPRKPLPRLHRCLAPFQTRAPSSGATTTISITGRWRNATMCEPNWPGSWTGLLCRAEARNSPAATTTSTSAKHWWPDFLCRSVNRSAPFSVAPEARNHGEFAFRQLL